MATSFEKKLIRDLQEDPWERLIEVRKRVQLTPLRMIRGRQLAAFQITPDVIEDLWYERMAAMGIAQIRLSDSSNTAVGWKKNMVRARKVGIDVVINLIFSQSQKHTDAYYAKRAREAARLKPHRICLKDPGALLTPERVRPSCLPMQAASPWNSTPTATPVWACSARWRPFGPAFILSIRRFPPWPNPRRTHRCSTWRTTPA
jgi:pyruvate/oxaloacetate carboxyltransferase